MNDAITYAEQPVTVVLLVLAVVVLSILVGALVLLVLDQTLGRYLLHRMNKHDAASVSEGLDGTTGSGKTG